MSNIYMAGYAGGTKTREELLTWSVWLRFEPEFRRRLLAMMDAVISSGRKIGVGGGWRSSETQKALFLSRYHIEDDLDYSGDTYWNGVFWEKNPGVAPAAPPGLSYHEPVTPDGFCYAVDLIGDVLFADTIAANYGLVHFGNINGEPWHMQPAELPHSRRNYKPEMSPIKVFNGFPVPQPPAPPKPNIIVPAPTLKLTSPVVTYGPEVAKLQQIMKFWGWYKGTADGWFGPVTKDGVMAMQRALGFTGGYVDGVYGPMTAAKYKAFATYMASIAGS